MTVQGVGGPILVGVDGSDSALEAVRWAAREAERRGTGLRLVQAFGWPAGRHLGQPAVGVDYRETMRRLAGEQVAAAAAAVAEVSPGLVVEQVVETGYPIPVLLAGARSAQLVVVGDRGLGGVTGLLVGSVATGLVAQAACPVVVVRETSRGATGPVEGPVVVGVDGSPTSEAALAFAFDAAAARRVPLVAVHTWWDLVVDPAMAPLLDWEAIEGDEHQLLAERLAGWGEKYPDVRVRRVVTRDRPAHALVRQTDGAQLVVVGSRGRGGLTGLLFGSVSHAVLHRARCPVAVVRPDGAGSAR